MDYSSYDLQTNYIISFCFCLYLVFHTCAVRFDVTENLKNFLIFRMNHSPSSVIERRAWLAFLELN